MTDSIESLGLKSGFDEAVQPPCKNCARPKLLRDRVIELGLQRDADDWPRTVEAYAGFVAMCPRAEAPNRNDDDPCLNMIEDRRCVFPELNSMDKAAMDARAAEILAQGSIVELSTD